MLKFKLELNKKIHLISRPDVVLFGEGLPNSFWKNLLDFPKCDLLIIIGTSLVVQPFAGIFSLIKVS